MKGERTRQIILDHARCLLENIIVEPDVIGREAEAVAVATAFQRQLQAPELPGYGLIDGAQHVIGGSNHFGVGLVGALG